MGSRIPRKSTGQRHRPQTRKDDVGRMSGVKIAPSILAADHADLKGEIGRVEEAGADMIHEDVTDGHFAPNIRLGPDTVRAIRKVTRVQLDIHLMITHPENVYKPIHAHDD